MKKGKTGKVLKIANTITKHVWKVVDHLAARGIYVSIENPKTSLLLGRMSKQSLSSYYRLSERFEFHSKPLPSPGFFTWLLDLFLSSNGILVKGASVSPPKKESETFSHRPWKRFTVVLRSWWTRAFRSLRKKFQLKEVAYDNCRRL